MSLPKPVVPLDDICSAIFDNTLYTFSAGAFQSLELTPGANWTQLESGESVTGGACVGSTPGNADLAGFWVVGGKAGNPDYQGLQKFTYSTGKWESITAADRVTKERQWHGVAYLTNTDTLLVYAGSQNGAQYASSETFTISASAPYGVRAWPADAPPPATNPSLLPWSPSQVALVGGTGADTRVMLFDSGSGWIPSGATLAAPLAKDPKAMKSVVITGDDNSRHLYTFDMTVSPNEVSRMMLIDGKGLPVQQAAVAPSKSKARRSRQRSRRQTKALTQEDWPQYNATLAPTATRGNYALAQDLDSGLVVAAGGNNDDVLSVFDLRANSWQNATDMLVEQKIFAQEISSSSSASSTVSSSSTSSSSSTKTTAPSSTLLVASSTAPSSTTATPTSTSSETVVAAAAQPPGMMSSTTLLGIVLGSIAGLGAILLVIYICLSRRRRRKQQFTEAGHDRRASGFASNEKDGFAYANDSLPRNVPRGAYRGGHQQQSSESSFSSVAILMSNVNNQNKSGVGRKNSKDSKRSSTSSIFNKAFKSTISKPIPQMTEQNFSPTPMRAEVVDERDMPATANGPQPRPGVSRVDPQDGTRRSSGWNRYWSGGSALNILGFGNGNGNGNGASKRSTVLSDESSHYSDRNRITQDSATVPPLQIPPMMPEAKPQFNRVNSGSPTISRYDPTALGMAGMRGEIERPVSHVSSLSAYSSGIPASVHEAWDPTSASDPKPWGTERAASSAYSGSSFTTPLAPASASNNGRAAAPSGVSQQPQLAMAATSSDMSWLNLGDQSRI